MRRGRIVSRAQAIMRFDGPALSSHEMDVRDLAPALLALGDVCVITNEILNGSSAGVQVLVRADVEQKCFQIQIELAQTIYEHLTAFLDDRAIQNAKNIFEWIGIIAGGTVFMGGGLFGLYKAITGEGLDHNSKIEAKAGPNGIVYQVVGNGNTTIIVPSAVHKLAQDPRMFPAVKRVVAPLMKDGYEKLEFEYDGRITQYFTRQEAQRIVEAPPEVTISNDGKYLTSQIKTTVRVRKAIYEGTAKWGVQYKKGIEAKIADEDWLRDFQAARVHVPPGSSLVVDIEEKVPIDEHGEQTGEAVYTIKKVHGVVPPTHQMQLGDEL